MKKTPQNLLFRTASIFAAFAIMLAQVALLSTTANAAQIVDRSLTLQAGTVGGATPGDPGQPGNTVKHHFTFTPGTAGATVGSIKFEYCTTPADAGVFTCTTPTDLDTTTASLEFENGATGFAIVNTTNGSPYITRTAGAVAGTPVLTYRLAGIINPSTVGTFFVRISTYASTDTTGSAIDTGSVAASTATPIELSGTMPESLVFCTGETIGLTATVPDCATATAGVIAFNQLFSPTDTAVASSQMAASTNAGSGYAITVNGTTLTSGGNTINGMAAADTSKKGNSQFGLNLVTNTVAAASGFPGSSADIAPASNGTNYKGKPTTDYLTGDTFKYSTGEVIAQSDDDGAGGSSLGGTDAQIYTVSYIANVPGSQPAGTYSSTLTYICTPTY